jgi:hypothetical protein
MFGTGLLMDFSVLSIFQHHKGVFSDPSWSSQSGRGQERGSARVSSWYSATGLHAASQPCDDFLLTKVASLEYCTIAGISVNLSTLVALAQMQCCAVIWSEEVGMEPMKVILAYSKRMFMNLDL